MSNVPSTPALAAIAAEFPAWQIDDRPGGLDVIVAYFRSPDGRHRHVIARPDAAGLLAALRRTRAKRS
jgi:hypothetical protein